MMLLNHTSRYHVAAAALRGAATASPRVSVDSHMRISEILHLLQKDKDYIQIHGADPPGTFEVPKF